MALEINSSNPTCTKCGKSYSRRKGFFPVSHAIQHKGIGYIPVCRDCVEQMYNQYLSVCNNPKVAVRQMCRKLDVYWDEKKYEEAQAMNTPRTVMTHYLRKISAYNFAGKSYDDSLIEEGTLWYVFKDDYIKTEVNKEDEEMDNGVNDAYEETEAPEVPEEVVAFWGSGFTPDKYLELEQRREYWMAQLPPEMEMDMGTKMLIKQFCVLDVDINNSIASGKSVEKSINALNNLVGSLNLKPAQRKSDTESGVDGTPFGVWIKRWEDGKPIPEVDPELQDVDGIVRYISIWFLGHLCKMLGIKNTYCKLYEDEIAKLRVERPEFDDEDDEMLFNDIFGHEGDDE